MASSLSEACSECRRVEKNGFRICTSHCFTVHIAGIWSKDKASKERKSERRHLLHNLVCALQNSKGGDIFIHLQDQQKGDRFLGHFDEFICRIFPNVTEDGEMSAELYSREWLFDSPGFEEFTTFVKLSVNAVNLLSTVEFNTKIRNDVENTEPSTRCLLRYLSKEVIEASKPKIRGIQDLEYLHESRNTELKMFSGESLGGDRSSLAEHIWYKLKLRDNLTSMAKLCGGGSIFVGIREREVKCDKYLSKTLEINGFEINDVSSFLDQLNELAYSHLVVLNTNGTFCDPPRDLYNIMPHHTHSSKYVLEVAVRQMAGILFYNKDGPRAYEIKHGYAQRMDKTEWFYRIKQWQTEGSRT